MNRGGFIYIFLLIAHIFPSYFLTIVNSIQFFEKTLINNIVSKYTLKTYTFTMDGEIEYRMKRKIKKTKIKRDE